MNAHLALQEDIFIIIHVESVAPLNIIMEIQLLKNANSVIMPALDALEVVILNAYHVIL